MLENTLYYEKRVLFGLFNKNNTALEIDKRIRDFVHYLNEEHFSGKYKNVYSIVARYYHMTNSLITANDFMDAVKNSEDVSEAIIFEYQQLLLELCFGEPIIDSSQIPDGKKGYITNAEFSYAVDRLKKQTQMDSYGAVLADTMQILTSGKTLNGKTFRGYRDAKEFYNMECLVVDRVGGQELPEGNIQDDAADIRQEYANAKHGGDTAFKVLTGITEVDKLTGGGMPGEMWFIAAFSGEGKTTQCINMTYQAMMDGKNIVFGTAETLRNQVRRRLISRHSIHPKFGYPKGLSADSIKKAILTPQEENILSNVIDDLANNKEYGFYKIVQIPNRCTVDYFRGLLNKYEHEFYVHAAVWDEVRLAGVTRGRQSRREELNDIITEAKQMAVNHRHLDDSRGILLFAPYQISRSNWQDASQKGRYTKACMAETSEAEKTADLILSQLVDQDNPKEIKCQILKYRDGDDKLGEFILDWQSDVCYIRSREAEKIDLLDSNEGDDL